MGNLYDIGTLANNDVVTVKITLPNNLDSTFNPNYIIPKILTPSLAPVSFASWGQIDLPLAGGEVTLTSGAATAGKYLLYLEGPGTFNIMRVVLVEATKTGSSEPILKVVIF